jgi:hypothetical protein
MNKALMVVAAALLATGCSPLLYSGMHAPARPLMAGPYQAPPPLPIGRWDNVMRLQADSTIDVLTMDGATVGRIAAADGWTVTIRVDDQEVQIPRADVLRIDVVDLPGSEARAVARRAARGALLGAGAAAVIGAVIGGPAWPPPGALVRAGAAGGAASGAQAAILQRAPRIVYLAPGQALPFDVYGRHSAGATPGRGELPACAEGRHVGGAGAGRPASAPRSAIFRKVK